MIQYRRILVTTDFSETAQAAIDYALELPQTDDAELLLVHAIEPSAYPVREVLKGSGALSYEAQVEKACKQHLEDVVTKIGDKAKVRTAILTGRPITEICAFAKNEDVDLIVIGSHGRSGIKRALLGSVAEGVLRHCDCPVLIVKGDR